MILNNKRLKEMNNYDKIKKFCQLFRLFLGSALIVTGMLTGIVWFYLGILPLIAGAMNFCPLCLITKKCTV